MKEKGQSSFNKRALEYRTNLDLKPRPLAPKHQVKFLDDQKNGYSERRIGRLMSPDQTSSRRASLPNNLLSSAKTSYSVPNYSPNQDLTLNVFDSGSTSAQLHSDANHSTQHNKEEARQELPPSGAQASGKSIKRPAESSSVPHKKSRRAKSHNDLEEADGDDDNRHSSAEDKKEEKFACPFYRKDPVRFLECMNLRLVSISIVKQHLKRRHAANSDSDRLGYREGFALSTVAGDHNTKGSCARGKTEGLDSIPPQILEALKLRSDRRMSSTDQWHEIWLLLFGESDFTPKPLLDGVVKEMTGIIRDIWSRDGDQIVSKHIQTRGMPVSSDQLLSLLPELLDSVEDRFENKPVEMGSDQQIAGTKKPALKMTTERIYNGHRYSTDPYQMPHHMPNVSNYIPISTSASLTRDSPTPIFGIENPYDLRSVGGVFELQAMPYSLTSFPAYLEPLNDRGISDSVYDPWGILKQISVVKMGMTEVQQQCLELQNNYYDNYTGDQELDSALPYMYR
ncbi:hypothetical protein FOVSG1_004851 [Fusarium oxysporum f. sp. vasinfectum]